LLQVVLEVDLVVAAEVPVDIGQDQ